MRRGGAAMAGQHADERIHGQGISTGHALKRRGILAAAGAAVAAVVAKQVAAPVGATNSSLQFPSSGTTVATNTATAKTVLIGSFDDPVYEVTNTATSSGAFGINIRSS